MAGRKREFVIADIHRRVMIYQRVGLSAPKIGRLVHKCVTTILSWQKNQVYQLAYEDYISRADEVMEKRFDELADVVELRFKSIITNPKTKTSDFLKAMDMYLKVTGQYPREPVVEQTFINAKEAYDREIHKLSADELEERLDDVRNRVTKRLEEGKERDRLREEDN